MLFSGDLCMFFLDNNFCKSAMVENRVLKKKDLTMDITLDLKIKKIHHCCFVLRNQL